MSVILIVRPSFRLAASVSHGEYADGQTDGATHKQCTHMHMFMYIPRYSCIAYNGKDHHQAINTKSR